MARRFPVLPCLALVALSLAAGEADRTLWKLNTFTWIRREAAEAGAPANAHPAQLPEAALAQALASVQAQVEGQPTALFTAEEAASLARALREALAVARPGEDLLLLSTQRRAKGIFDPSQGVTARLFLREGALNLLVHDVRSDFMDRYAAERVAPAFTYGSRKQPSSAILSAPGATALRPDWLALPLASPAAAAAAAPAPVPTAAPRPAPAPEAAKPAPRDAAYYAAQSERLKALKKMRDEGLLSEAEYAAKREAILKEL